MSAPTVQTNPWYWAAAVAMVACIVLTWTASNLVVTSVGLTAPVLIGIGYVRDRRRE